MKQLIIFILLMFSRVCYGQVIADKDRLDTYLATHVSYFTFNGQRPVGRGWDTLDSLFEKDQFVAWGEYHNSPLLSQLTAYALESASKHGFKNWCIEVGPYTAAELTRISHMESPADTIIKLFKEGYPKIGTFPFFSSRDDAQMLISAQKFGYSLWGIDQEFQMSFPYCLKMVYGHQSNKFRQQYRPLYDSLQAKWWYPKTVLIDSLMGLIKQKKDKDLLQGIKVSKEIYRNGDNAARAALMKANFFSYYDQMQKNEKVFFKMGSNHLAKGMNLQTNLYDIGNAIYELSQRNRTGFANVYLIVRYTMENGKLIDDLSNVENENPRVFSGLYEKDKWTLVDLRNLKVKYDGTLPRDTYQLVEKYDYVLISPEILNIEQSIN